MARRVLVLVALAAVFIGCGGKILVEETERGDASAGAATEGVAPSSMGIGEACATICERDGRCGAWKDACEARCLAQAASGCGASEWLTCFAERLDGCLGLPPACEPAYCAWAACAGRPVPDYCH